MKNEVSLWRGFFVRNFLERKFPTPSKNLKQIILKLLEYNAVLNFKCSIFSKVETTSNAAAHLTGFFFEKVSAFHCKGSPYMRAD